MLEGTADAFASIVAAERRDLFGENIRSSHKTVKAWGWPKAEEEFRRRLALYVHEE